MTLHKVLSILLAVVLAMTLGAPAMAAPAGSKVGSDLPAISKAKALPNEAVDKTEATKLDLQESSLKEAMLAEKPIAKVEKTENSFASALSAEKPFAKGTPEKNSLAATASKDIAVAAAQQSNVSTVVTLNGAPIEGAVVELYYYDSGWYYYVGEGTTDATGNVTIIGVPNGDNYCFWVDGTDEYLTYDGEIWGKQFSVPGEVPAIELDAGHTTTTTVTLNDVPQVNVWVHLYSIHYFYDDWAFTDENGNATFYRVPAGEELSFEVDGTYDFVMYEGINKGKTFVMPGDVPAIELEVGEAVTTTVKLNGVPQADVYVEIVSTMGRFSETGYTDENGNVTFPSVSTGVEFYFMVWYETDDYLRYSGVSKGITFTLPGDVPTIELETGETITTTVTLNGIPQAYTDVYVGDVIGYYSETETTDENGEVTFNRMPTGVELYFYVGETDTYFSYDGELEGKPFTLPGNVPTIELDGGQVTTTVTLNGVPQASVCVYICDETGWWYYDYTDENGTVTFSKLPKGVEFFFYVDEYYTYLAYNGALEGKTFTLPGDVPTIELDAGQTVTTTVTLNGVPQANVWVYVFDENTYWNSNFTDENGEVTLPALPEGVELYFRVDERDEYIFYDGLDKGKTFTLPGDVPAIELEAGTTATTTVTLNGVLQPNVLVDVFCNYNDYESVYTDENGIASFSHLPTGVTLYFWVGGTDQYASYIGHDKGKTFTLPGDAPTIELEAVTTVTTTVTLNGLPQAYKEVCAYSENYFYGSVYTDENGEATFSDLPTGVELYFYVDGMFEEYVTYDGLDIGKTFTLPGTVPAIELEAGATATTTVTLNGVLQPDLRVYVYSKGAYYETAFTDENGVATFSKLPTGVELYFGVEQTMKSLNYDGELLGKFFTLPGTAPTIELYDGSVRTKVTLNGTPRANVAVSLYKDGVLYKAAQNTNANGEVTFWKVPAGLELYFCVDETNNYVKYDGSLLNKKFTMPGIAPTIALTSKTTPTSDKKSKGGSGGGSSAPAAPVKPATIWVKTPEAKTLAATAKAKGIPAATRSTGSLGMELDALKALTGLTYRHDTIDGSMVAVRVSFAHPELATQALLMSGFVKGDAVNAVRDRFAKWYKNQIRVIHLDQKDSFGITAEIAAKVDLTGMNTKNLYFYSYNKVTNTYKAIANPKYYIDANGYLHFTTNLAGDIIVCDGALTPKG